MLREKSSLPVHTRAAPERARPSKAAAAFAVLAVKAKRSTRSWTEGGKLAARAGVTLNKWPTPTARLGAIFKATLHRGSRSPFSAGQEHSAPSLESIAIRRVDGAHNFRTAVTLNEESQAKVRKLLHPPAK
jgi:hypothetical protein